MFIWYDTLPKEIAYFSSAAKPSHTHKHRFWIKQNVIGKMYFRPKLELNDTGWVIFFYQTKLNKRINCIKNEIACFWQNYHGLRIYLYFRVIIFTSTQVYVYKA